LDLREAEVSRVAGLLGEKSGSPAGDAKIARLCWIYARLNDSEKAASASTYKEKLDDAELERQFRDEVS